MLRRFIFIVTFCGMIVGCAPRPEPVSPLLVQQQPQADPKKGSIVRETFYAGHSYLHFRWNDNFGSGTVHNPDCKTCKY